MQHSAAREHVLNAAEGLFATRGYAAVTIKEIAQAAGIHHASLYHHAPGGKEQLFIEVTERTLQQHQRGIDEAIAAGAGDVRAQLRGIAAWLMDHPPLDLIRMVHSDLPAIDPAAAFRLADFAHRVVLVPIEALLRQAQARGDVGQAHLGHMAGALFSAIEGLHTLPDEFLEKPRVEIADDIIAVFLRGLKPE
jgi:AcrR family transcriptional regulator